MIVWELMGEIHGHLLMGSVAEQVVDTPLCHSGQANEPPLLTLCRLGEY
jgi:hypothetical protein